MGGYGLLGADEARPPFVEGDGFGAGSEGGEASPDLARFQQLVGEVVLLGALHAA
jgi:hypothetical protein